MPWDEAGRLQELARYQILDTGPEEAFDDLTRLAGSLCGTPIALISLVDAERQWFKSRVGLAAQETPREVAFCDHALREPEGLLVVEDPRADARFRDNPLVTGEPRVGFYAGSVLRGRGGYPLGTLCVIDHAPRQLNEAQRAALDTLARQVERLLELRRAVHDLRETVAARGRTEELLRRRVADLASGSGTSSERVPLRRWAPLGLLTGALLLLSGAAAVHVDLAAAREHEAAAERALDEVAQALAERLQSWEDLVLAERALFRASSSVEADEWTRFVAELNLVSTHPDVHRMGWASEPRAVFGPDPRDGGGSTVRALVTFAAPASGAQAVLGQDLARDPERRAALHWSRDHGRIATTSTTGLLSTGEPAVVLLAPVFRGEPGTLEERRAQLVGWVFTSVRLASLGSSLPAASSLGLIVVDDRGARILGRAALRGRPADGPPLCRELPLGNRVWRVEGHPLERGRDGQAFLVACTGGLLALLVALLGSSAQRRRQRAEADARHLARALRDLEARTRIVLDHVADGVVVYRRSGTLEDLNPAAEALLGWGRDEALGRDVSGLLPGLLGQPGERAREGTLLRRDGSSLHAQVTVRQASQGPDPLLVAVVSDETDRHESDRQKSEFLSVVNHELRTPITAIQGSLELLSGGFLGELPDEAREVTELAERNGRRLIGLVNDLLTLERLDCGRLEVVLSDVALDDVARRSLEAVAPQAHTAGVVLAHELAPVRARADADRVEQVLVNLLANAVKFSPRGAQVLVRVLPPAAGSARIEVVDHGRGIPPAARGQLFRRFSQLERGDERQKGGMGLGLEIARRIVELHGGRIGVESEEGQGSTFWCELPLAREGQA